MTDDASLRALAERLGERCQAVDLTVATAESCTGGLVAHAITEVPGSSRYFRGAVVAYSDEVKIAELGVPAQVIAAHGAVSVQVARSMAAGVRERLGVDLAVAVTGIAGPGGATPGKPVGLTYIAIAGPGGETVQRLTWTGDRSENKRSSAASALELLLAAAEAAEPGPRSRP